MTRHHFSLAKVVIPGSALIMLAGCGSAKTPGDAAASGSHVVGPSVAAGSAAPGALPAAAESFEALTELAFTAKPAQLSSLLTNAKQSASNVSDRLSASTNAAVSAQLKVATGAVAAGNRADVALSAVEGYKLIVSAFPRNAQPPVAVNLLDYAGFRIQADMNSRPVRWADAQDALNFARGQWSQIRSSVADSGLGGRFTQSLVTLDQALAARNAVAAQAAVEKELSLVDDLESYFKLSPKVAGAPSAK